MTGGDRFPTASDCSRKKILNINNNNKKVLYHLRTQGTGSEGIHIRGMVNAFRNLGLHVDFIWPLGDGDPTERAGKSPYDRKKTKSAMEYVVPFIPGFVFAIMEFMYNFWALRKFKSALKSESYDFIYERHFFFSFASGLISRKFNIPLVVEVNELAGFKRVRKNHLTSLARRCEKSLFGNAALISVVSTFIRDTILERYPGIDPEKIVVIPNGVEKSMLSVNYSGDRIREKYNTEDRIVFGFVGFLLHISTWHSLEWFVPSFIRSARQYPDAVLMLVGGGPGRKNLEETGRRMDFDDRLIFTGNVPNNEIGHYLDAMDIGVVPHTNEYRSPIKMFEYMALGKPVLAPDQEPVLSIIGDIQKEYLFKAKSEESLARAISFLIKDRHNWRNRGEKLRELIAESYTYDRHGERILNLLNLS